MPPWPTLSPYSKTFSTPNGDLFYYDTGKNAAAVGKPTIVLIHGLADEADTWRHIVPGLTGAGYRVIAPDLPGFGRSLWKGRINVQRHRDAVIRLIHETGAASREHPAVFAGSSLGAGIAELIAIQQPELVHSLILIDGCFPFPYKLEKGLFLVMLPFVGKSWYRSFRSNHEAAWKSLYPYYHDLDAMNGTDKDFLRERVIARVESVNQERGYFATLRSMNAFFLCGKRSIGKKIQAFPGNIHMLWGEHDRVIPPEKAGMFRSLRPDASFTLIPNTGHLPHQENPQVTVAEILRGLGTRD